MEQYVRLCFWVIEFGASFAEMFFCTVFCDTLLKAEHNKNKSCAYSVIYSVIIILINHISLYSPLQSAFTLIVISVLCCLKYPENKAKSVVFGIIFLLLFAAVDNIVVSLISYIFEIPSAEIYKEFSFMRVFAIVTSKTFLMLFTVTLSHMFDEKSDIKKTYVLTTFFISIGLMFVNFAVTFIDINNQNINSITTVTLFVMIFLLICVIFFGSFRMTRYYNTQNELSLEKMKNHMLEQSMNETRQSFELIQSSLHDYRHNIINLRNLAENGDIEGIMEFTDKEIEIISNRLFYYKTGNNTADSIIYIKQKKAENLGIPFVITADIPENFSISPQNLVSLLGNLLDNAIEASQKEQNPYIEVSIRPVNSYMAIAVKNKCSDYDPNVKTSKKDTVLHGIGLKTVRRIIKELNGEIKIIYKNNVFSVNIILPTEK